MSIAPFKLLAWQRDAFNVAAAFRYLIIPHNLSFTNKTPDGRWLVYAAVVILDIMTNTDLLLGFGLLLLAAALAKVATPVPRRWNNNRAATQRDVADVLAGRGKRDSRADEALLFATILMIGVLFYAVVM